MRQQSKESLFILFIIGALILNYPFVYLFDRPWTLFGIPLLYLYLYLVWLVMILLLIVIIERSAIETPPDPPDSTHDSGNANSTSNPVAGSRDHRRSHP